MSQSKQNDIMVKVGNWVASKLDKFELILTFAFLIVILLKMTSDIPVGVLLVLTLSSLITLYLFSSRSISDDEHAGGIERFIYKIASMSLAICLIGVLFRLRNWPGVEQMLLLGSITLLFSFIAIIYLQSKKPELTIFTKRMKIRILIVGAVGLSLYFTTAEELVEIFNIKIIK